MALPSSLPFPPITCDHISNCSYPSWYSRCSRLAGRCSIIPLTAPFLDYLRSDGILLPPSDPPSPILPPSDAPPSPSADSAFFSHTTSRASSPASSSWSDQTEGENPARLFPELHLAIYEALKVQGGRVFPKLNWSAPKDSTWILPSNSMECRSVNDVYLLLKSSDFITHDLEHAFDGCTPPTTPAPPIPYHLILRRAMPFQPSLEFRVFVRQRKVLAMCQRDMNYYPFLQPLAPILQEGILDFFDDNLRDNFTEDNYAFDIYVPKPTSETVGRIWLVDINPWARRTDPLLFSWLELLTMPAPKDTDGDVGGAIRLSLADSSEPLRTFDHGNENDGDNDDDDASLSEEEEDELPELRLVGKDDPEAYAFNSAKYSAHKLPRDLVDVGLEGPGPMRQFADQWREMTEQRERQEAS